MNALVGLIGLVFVLNFVCWIVAALMLWAGIHVLRSMRDTAVEQRMLARRMGVLVAARADEENAAVLAGDQRGVYGEYPPAV
jgi:hypothetical protein